MLYFIPAWYQQNEWCENEQYWYTRRARTEFDDTVKHIQLFHRSQAYPFKVMLLSFAPNFRHFLHRQSVFHAPYWSCFDAIQEVRRKKVMPFSFHNLKWPKHIEFIYSPFALSAQLNGERYAQVEFGEDGNLIQVDMYVKGVISRRNIYDDRGFISSTILFEEGRPKHQDYLTDKAVWKIRQFYEDGRVEINPKHSTYLLECNDKEYVKKFSKNCYDNMEQVVEEVTKEYLSFTEEKDIFCIAMHNRHTSLLRKVLENKKRILSFFEDRYDLQTYPEGKDMVEKSDYIITDSQENQKKIQQIMGMNLDAITDITPFDSRVDFGISQQLNVQKILVPVDGLEDYRFEELIQKLGEYIPTNENARIHLFTRVADFHRKKQLLDKTRSALQKAGMEVEWAAEKKAGYTENQLDMQDSVPIKFFVEQCVDELSMSKCIREQRLIVDMRHNVEVYMQISGISMGIPQIVCKKSQFIEHEKNGFVLKDMSELPKTMSFYLDSLTNWNEAVVNAYEIGKKYTTQVLIEKWKEVISFVGND